MAEINKNRLWEYIPPVEWVDISVIKPYEKNAKEHTEAQVKQIADSIREHGWVQPLVIDKENIITIGHGRILAAKLLGASKVPCFRAEHLTPQQIRVLRIADNKLNESEWLMDVLKLELKEFSADEIKLTGFNPDIILDQSANPEDDETPELPAEPKSKLGDIYQLGKHRLMCGDSTKVDDVEKLMNGQKADLVFTDPPYNVDYEGKTKNKLKIQNDKKGDNDFLQFLRDAFSCLAQSMKRGGAIYVCHADSEGLNFRTAFKDAGFLMKQCLIWNKNSMVMGRQDYQWKHEPILYGWLDGASHSFYGGRNQVTVWDIDRPTKSESHPTMKPVELVIKAIANSSKEDDVVLDTFMGSGSTLIACEKAGRISYGMELDPKYIDCAIERWEKFTGEKAVKLNK